MFAGRIGLRRRLCGVRRLRGLRRLRRGAAFEDTRLMRGFGRGTLPLDATGIRAVGRMRGRAGGRLDDRRRATRPLTEVRSRRGRVGTGPDRIRRPWRAARPVGSVAVMPPAHRRRSPRQAGVMLVTAAPERRGKEIIRSAVQAGRAGPSMIDDTAVVAVVAGRRMRLRVGSPTSTRRISR